jgi:hypothetical protein
LGGDPEVDQIEEVKMKLLTKEIEGRMPKLYATEAVPTGEKIVQVKFFDPSGSWTWYAVEGERTEDGDYHFFGLVDGHVKEWGYFSLRELESIRGRFGLGIERDIYFDPVPVVDVDKRYFSKKGD